jgi:hypothetical protein
MMFIPLLVFSAAAVLLLVLFCRTRTAARSSSYAGDTWTPMTWTDGNADSPCDSSGTADCGGAVDAHKAKLAAELAEIDAVCRELTTATTAAGNSMCCRPRRSLAIGRHSRFTSHPALLRQT